MNPGNIKPEKVTKPIQLLAAWLLGLVLIDTLFLTASASIEQPLWGPNALIIAAIINVPLFLVSLFTLQTKFRPEMQEDTYYSKYLENKKSINDRNAIVPPTATEIAKEIIDKTSKISKPKDKEKLIEIILKEKEKNIAIEKVGSSRTLSELYLYPHDWKSIVGRWKNDNAFLNDIDLNYEYKTIVGNPAKLESIKLSDLGKEIAKEMNEKNQLWHQLNRDK